MRQERQETSIIEHYIQHADDDHFLVNMYSLHQPHLLCSTLPLSLQKVELDHPNSRAFHDQVSHGLTEGRAQKRVNASEKRQATLASKKKDKEKQLQVQAPQIRADQGENMDTFDEDEDEYGPESEDE